jgi:hypothetical protein
LKRELLARGIFTSVNDLARKLPRFIRKYSDVRSPFGGRHVLMLLRPPIA